MKNDARDTDGGWFRPAEMSLMGGEPDGTKIPPPSVRGGPPSVRGGRPNVRA